MSAEANCRSLLGCEPGDCRKGAAPLLKLVVAHDTALPCSQAMGRLKELAQSGIHFCVGLDLEPYGEVAGRVMKAVVCKHAAVIVRAACMHTLLQVSAAACLMKHLLQYFACCTRVAVFHFMPLQVRL